MLAEGLIFYVGWALIPTPPSPVPDFGLQFLFAVVIGLISPKFLVNPINIFARFLGNTSKSLFEKIPLIRILVEKIDKLFHRWESSLQKERKSDKRVVNWFYRLFIKEDFIQRLIFGYFVSILLGILLIITATFLL